MAEAPLASDSETGGVDLGGKRVTAADSHQSRTVGRLTRAMIVVLVCRLALGGGLTLAALAPTWTELPSPSTQERNGALTSVSCTEASFCVSAGSFVKPNGSPGLFNNMSATRGWRRVVMMVPSGTVTAQLAAISCASPRQCFAVGSYATTVATMLPLSELWSGDRWTLESVATRPGFTRNALASVTCLAGPTCMTVGRSDAGPGTISVSLVERWNGTHWAVESAPPPKDGKSSSFTGVSCASTNSCTAVGWFGPGPLLYSETDAFAEIWDGVAWSFREVVLPTLAGGSFLLGVSCLPAGESTGVGAAQISGRFVPISERWTSGPPTVQIPPNDPAGGDTQFDAISCSATGCMALVTKWSSSAVYADRWDGVPWIVHRLPKPLSLWGGTQWPETSVGLSCGPSDNCLVVGSVAHWKGLPQSVTETWNGRTWNLERIADPFGRASDSMTGVSCVSATSCMAIGATDRGVVSAWRWDGKHWTAESLPAETRTLSDVSCSGQHACTAVGLSSRGLLADRWNGRSWRASSLPAPSGSASLDLAGVSCASPTMCIATGSFVGGDHSGDRQLYTIVERWDGRSWKIMVAKPRYLGLADVSCLSLTKCQAVGGSWPTVAQASRWNGSAWISQSLPQPVGDAELVGVSCVSSAFCAAGGTYEDGLPYGGQEDVLEMWNGKKWSLRSNVIPRLPRLFAVSCIDNSHCESVGLGSGTVAAAGWNGVRWSVQHLPTAGNSYTVLSDVSCMGDGVCMAVGSSASVVGSGALVVRYSAGRS